MDSNNIFQQIIDIQLSNKIHYTKTHTPSKGTFSIEISNNSIKRISDGKGWVHPTRKSQYIELIKNTLNKYNLKDCNININLNDHPLDGYFNFCRLKTSNKQFLLPNHRFTNEDIKLGNESNNFKIFDDSVKFLRSNKIDFNEKKNKIYTSCVPGYVKNEYFNYSLNKNFCNGYMWIGSTHKLGGAPKHLIDKMIEKSMAGVEYIPFIKHDEYKYVLYTDGNTLSDRMRLLLCLNSIIIKKTSNYEEFYTYLLKSKENYIEYNNTNELEQIYESLEKDNELCHQIIQNNKKFIDENLTYDNILKYTADIINNLT